MTLQMTQIKDITNERLLLLRAITRILNSENFEKAYNRSSDAEKETLTIIIYNSNKPALLLWIKKILKLKNIYDLHYEAEKLGILNYRRMSKEILEYEIKKKSQKQESIRRD